MGRFVNPRNRMFETAAKTNTYIDKTGLIHCTNMVLDTSEAFICNSRPRRFGKTITASMLATYYGKGYTPDEVKKIFSGLQISKSDDFDNNIGKYDVIYIDMQSFSAPEQIEKIPGNIEEAVIKELRKIYPKDVDISTNTLPNAISDIYVSTGKTFIIIIDEWDMIFRDFGENRSVIEAFKDFVRRMFKDSSVSSCISLAYLTGILPVPKQTTESAMNNFQSYTMIDAGMFAPYIGFTEDEVKNLCRKHDCDYEEMKLWYDGYIVDGYQIYNPTSVVTSINRRKYQSYWSKTGAIDLISYLINRDFDGLKTDILNMLAGNDVKIEVMELPAAAFAVKNRNEVMTTLIHLGYLGYNRKEKTVFIPNEEIRCEILKIVNNDDFWTDIVDFEKLSSDIVKETIGLDCNKVAENIEKIHRQYVSSLEYNDENSLSCVITIAYLMSMEYYFKPVRELPAGDGFADFVYIPKPEYIGIYPALLIELKWNKNTKTAINQINEKKYPESLEQYTGNILLVGINYDKKTKKHKCEIQKYKK